MSALQAGLWTLPSVFAFLLSSLLGPRLARVLPSGRVVAGGLVVMGAGFAVLAGVGLGGGLAAVVTGTVLFSLGLAPVYILTTELVVSTVRPERAGMAAAVTETGSELGGALGIAVLGSVSVAAFRYGMDGSSVTLADAMTAGVAQAGPAYTSAFALMALVAAVLVTAAAVPAWRVLRPTAPTVEGNAPEPSDMVDAPVPVGAGSGPAGS
jgi:DHA2 family multidrug resistance protein-like MFS transporter